MRTCLCLREEEERDPQRQEEEEERDGAGDDAGRSIGGVPRGHNEAGGAGGDLAADPVLVLGHPGVHPRGVGQGAAKAEAHHPGLHPAGAVLVDHGAPGVPLQEERGLA